MDELQHGANMPENHNPKLFVMRDRDIFMAALMCLVAILFSAWALWGGFRLGYTIVSYLMFISMTAYLVNRKNRISLFSWLCGILACVLPIVFLLTSNGTVRFFGFCAESLLQCVWFASLGGKKIRAGDMGLLRSLFSWLLPRTFGNMPRAVASVFAKKSKSKSSFGKAMLGVLLAVPVLLIVVPLLISSDEAFSGMLSGITDDIGQLIPKLLVGLLITPLVVSFCLYMKKVEEIKRESKTRRGVENTILISFLSVLSFCYLLYLFSQLAYFFSAFSGFLPEDYEFNVSTYARRGFFEMTAIAAINFLIIFAVLLLSRKRNGKTCIVTRLLCLFICLFTLMIIATALSKMRLYIKSFGLTVMRINTSAFMVFLAVVVLALILRLFSSKIRVLQVGLITASCILILLGGVNVNRVAAEYNYQGYKSGMLESIDVEHMLMLGDEGIPYLLELKNDSDPDVSQMASTYLRSQIRVDYYWTDVESGIMIVEQRRHSGIADYSTVRSEAYRLLDEYISNNSEYAFE